MSQRWRRLAIVPIMALVASLSFGQLVGPTITGIFPIFSTVPVIQPGSWISIYGTEFACGVYSWSGNFPLSLGNNDLRVTINGKAAYLSYANDTQINAQAPDDTATGTVEVDVYTSAACGGFGPEVVGTSTVTLAQFGPSFSLLDAKHVAGIILRSNGSGAYGKGANSYDIIGPTGSSLGYSTVAAKAGDVIEFYGVGFGPTTYAVPAGKAFSGAASTTNQVTILIDNVSVISSFAGLSSAGLYQFNLTIPAGLGTGDQTLVAIVGGVQAQPGVMISLQ